MSMVITPDTPYGKELWKWDHMQSETHPSDPSVRGMRPASFQLFPSQMYRVVSKNPWRFETERAADEVAQRNLESRGFVSGGQQAAADAYDAQMQGLAVAAAERNARDRNMSERALAESSAAEQESSQHLGEIPTTPIKKRGRKKSIVQ